MLLINKIKQDPFFRNYLIVFSSSIVAAFLSYLFHPILGRLLSVADFGEVQALLALYTQLAIFFSVFSLITVNISANIEDQFERVAVIKELKKIALGLSGFLILGILLFSGSLQKFFHFSNDGIFIGLALLLFINASLLFRNAYLQGQSNFKAISLAGILGAGGKLILAVIFVAIGFRVAGAMAGLVAAQLLVYGYVFAKTRNVFRKDPAKADIHALEKNRVAKELYYGLLVLAATGCITLLYTSDILIIKRLFSGEIAGLYSGISLAAKIIFFATGAITSILLPTVKLKNEEQKNKTVLKKSFLLLFLTGGGLFLLFSLFPRLVITLLFGSNYLALSWLLPKLALLMFLISIVNLFFYYFLALRRFFLLPLAIISLMILAALTSIHHDTLAKIINNFIYTTIFILFCLMLFYLLNRVKLKKLRFSPPKIIWPN